MPSLVTSASILIREHGRKVPTEGSRTLERKERNRWVELIHGEESEKESGEEGRSRAPLKLRGEKKRETRRSRCEKWERVARVPVPRKTTKKQI